MSFKDGVSQVKSELSHVKNVTINTAAYGLKGVGVVLGTIAAPVAFFALPGLGPILGVAIAAGTVKTGFSIRNQHRINRQQREIEEETERRKNAASVHSMPTFTSNPTPSKSQEPTETSIPTPDEEEVRVEEEQQKAEERLGKEVDEILQSQQTKPPVYAKANLTGSYATTLTGIPIFSSSLYKEYKDEIDQLNAKHR